MMINNKESFSNYVKEEILLKKPSTRNEVVSELYGLLFSKNSVRSKNLYFRTELLYIANRVTENLDKINILDYSISYIRSNKITNQKIYVIKIENQYDNIKKIFNNLDDKWILKGFFISSGYIRDPKKAYSLDFFVQDMDSSLVLYDILSKIQVNASTTSKKNSSIVYVRNRENILDVLIVLDGINSFFKYEEITIKKEMSLKITRSINYEVANETKKIKNSNKQIRIIKKIKEKYGFENLTMPLVEACNARLENEDLSLQELADKLKITKSGLRNRFRRLEAIYDKIK